MISAVSDCLKFVFLNIENTSGFLLKKKQLSHLDQCQKPISEHNKRFFITQFLRAMKDI